MQNERTKLYHDIFAIPECLLEVQFDFKYDEFKTTWAANKLILNNVVVGQVGHYKWLGMWPRFNYLYIHRFVNIKNLVKTL